MQTKNTNRMNALMEVLKGSNDQASTRLVGGVLGTVPGLNVDAEDGESKHELEHEHEQDNDDEVEVIKDTRKAKKEKEGHDSLKYLTSYYADRTKEEGKKIMQDWTKHLFLKSALIPIDCLKAGTQSR